jgi:hypothetical protein
MRNFTVIVAVLAFVTVAVFPACGMGYQTDRGTRGFLFYHLISGAELTFPPQAVQQKLKGSGFFVMRLRPDGMVESVTTRMSTGYRILDEHIIRLLKTYRFRVGTKQPILWLVGFVYPDTVIVKLNLLRAENSPSPSKTKK